MGRKAERGSFNLSSSGASRTPAFWAASKQLSSKMSQAPNTRSFRPARGTKSLMRGLRPSVRLPSRTVESCVTEPIGLAIPRRIASTPAMNVVVTAPMPGIKMPSFPSAGAILVISLIRLSLFSCGVRVNGGERRWTICYDSKFMQERATAILTAMIVDDEQLAQDELAYLIKDISDIEVVGVARHGLEAVELIQKLEPDLVFLDVQMPGLDGLGVVRRLREKNIELPHIIFATAFDQYAVEAFHLEAMDYLLKPIDHDRLEETLERARRAIHDRQKSTAPDSPRLNPQRTKLLVRNSNRNFIVDAQDMIYATIADGLITLVTTTMEGFSNYKTIEELHASLDRDT